MHKFLIYFLLALLIVRRIIYFEAIYRTLNLYSCMFHFRSEHCKCYHVYMF